MDVGISGIDKLLERIGLNPKLFYAYSFDCGFAELCSP